MKFGEKLKTLRIKNELSQEQLAERMNVSRQAVTKWENNNGMPDIENLKQIANIFDVTIDSLVYEEEEIETTDDAFCWEVAWMFGIIGLMLSFMFDGVFNNTAIVGITMGVIGYILGKVFLIVKSKK
ncbi:MAG: helix-turn-helix domain-containing protein [Peptostreptococcaceae bacterium]